MYQWLTEDGDDEGFVEGSALGLPDGDSDGDYEDSKQQVAYNINIAKEEKDDRQ